MMKVRMMMLAAIAIAVTACDKNNNEENAKPEVKLVTNFAADTVTGFSPTGRPVGTGRFTYFSLRENKIITGADTLTNKWDIAIREFYIKVNGGTSATGGGNGAAFLANSTFDAYTMIPSGTTGWMQDNAPNYAINPAPGNWYTYSPSTFIALPVPGKIFVIRTADGRFAKMEITSLYKDGITPDVALSPAQKALKQFFYQFRYSFQANGSVNF
jgi:hypothetical protein